MKKLWLGILMASALLPGSLFAQDADKVDAEFPYADPAAGEEASTIRYMAPSLEQVRQSLLALMQEKSVDLARQEEALKILDQDPQPLPGEQMLERLVQSIAVFDVKAAELLTVEATPWDGKPLVDVNWLLDPGTPRFLAENLRLYHGIWLSRQKLHDELDGLVADMSPDAVVDPAALLFYQSVAHHHLLRKEEGLATLMSLKEEVATVPPRYRVLAGLMETDLASLEDESLDHVARRMEIIERHLDLGRAGKRVRDLEDGVIESLDKMIKEAEDQQRQQQQRSASRSRSRPSPNNQPMKDSRIAEMKGKGDVDQRDIGDESGWGDLPPKQREEALQQIGKEFPSHYRDAIEQYFRRLASQEGGK